MTDSVLVVCLFVCLFVFLALIAFFLLSKKIKAICFPSKLFLHQREQLSIYNSLLRRGARFSKVLRTFRARKASRKTTTRLFCKAGLFICCKENKNKNNCKDAFVLKIQRDLCHPKYARKVSGLSRNRPQGSVSPSPETFRVVSSKRRCSVSRNFAVISIFILFTTCEKTSSTE